MKQSLLYILCLCFSSFTVHATFIPSDEFIQYHVQVAMEEVEDEDIFNLIQENVNNLDHAGTTNNSAQELIHLIEEGYKIDPFNMSKLIEILRHANASNNATTVIVKAIEYDSTITPEHLSTLIRTLGHANSCANATTIILKAIEHGVKFGPKERALLAEMSKIANARGNVEIIRKALHERAMQVKA